MRTVFLIGLLLVPFFIKGQDITPTTEEEYNYGAVGYRIQLQARLDTKKGYMIHDLETYEEETRKIDFKGLYRKGEEKPCVVIMIYSRLRNAPLYYSIPTTNADPSMWDRFHRSLTTGTDNPQEQLQFFTLALAKMMMVFSAK